jgi:AcrR family transcriptional regulator
MPNRAGDLVWDDSEDAAPARLTRARVVRAAVAVADAEGLTAVSIRRVASELGVRPMSLYSHIGSKDDLVALMLNEVSGQLLVPEPQPEDWREALRRIARRAFDAYLAHPWMLHALGRGPRVGPNHLRRAEQSAAAVAPLGLQAREAWTALSIVHEWTMGHALHVITLHEHDQLEDQLRGADPATYPELSRVFGASGRETADAAFEIALEAVLDGIERRFGGPVRD